MDEQARGWLPQARRAVFELYRRQAARVWIEAQGASMRPLIGPGTWMQVAFGAQPRGVGEIVLFARGDRLVAHRVVAWARPPDRGLLLAKGDAEAYADPPLRSRDVMGVVRALRQGPEEPVSSVGCTGRLAFAVAQLSRWSGCGAALARRAATLLPNPLRRVVLRAIPLCTWVAAQVLLAPLRWVAWIQTIRPIVHPRKEVSNP
jgi:hypothetical protein